MNTLLSAEEAIEIQAVLRKEAVLRAVCLGSGGGAVGMAPGLVLATASSFRTSLCLALVFLTIVFGVQWWATRHKRRAWVTSIQPRALAFAFAQNHQLAAKMAASKPPAVKEIKLRPQSDELDIAFKTKAARKFLESGHRVQLTVRFRGREVTPPEKAQEQLWNVVSQLEDIARVEVRSPSYVVLAPKPLDLADIQEIVLSDDDDTGDDRGEK